MRRGMTAFGKLTRATLALQQGFIEENLAFRVSLTQRCIVVA